MNDILHEKKKRKEAEKKKEEDTEKKKTQTFWTQNRQTGRKEEDTDVLDVLLHARLARLSSASVHLIVFVTH